MSFPLGPLRISSHFPVLVLRFRNINENPWSSYSDAMLNRFEFRLVTVSNDVVSWKPCWCLLGLTIYMCPVPNIPPLISVDPSKP